jgi:hypothetical protein
MICCFLAAALLTPLGLWARPGSAGAGSACCFHRRLLLALSVLGLMAAAACLALIVLAPAPFRHICRFLIPG